MAHGLCQDFDYGMAELAEGVRVPDEMSEDLELFQISSTFSPLYKCIHNVYPRVDRWPGKIILFSNKVIFMEHTFTLVFFFHHQCAVLFLLLLLKYF